MAYCRIMAQESESRSLDKVIVRLPDGMRDRIKAAAEANNRSMNAEIVHRLQTTLDMDDYQPKANAHPDDTAIKLAEALLLRLKIEKGAE